MQGRHLRRRDAINNDLGLTARITGVAVEFDRRERRRDLTSKSKATLITHKTEKLDRKGGKKKGFVYPL